MIELSSQDRMISDFVASQGTYSDLGMVLEQLISTLIRNGGYTVHSVSSRCKTKESLAKKLALPEKSYIDLANITDITGLRIITYFSEDVDVIARIIEKEFTIDPERSIDKRQTLDPDRFGYQSLHFVAAISSTRCVLSEYRKFEGMKFEVQIRSILQHAWAEIEHDLGYKSASGVPRQIRRRFARVAGLLELADEEFSNIRSDLNSYIETVQRDITNEAPRIELNLPSLLALYRGKSNVGNLDAVVAEAAKIKVVQDLDAIDGKELPWLQKLNIWTIKDIENAAQVHRIEIHKLASYWLEGCENSEYGMGIGLFYLTYLLLFKTKDKDLILDYCVDRDFDDPESVAMKLLDFRPK